MNGIKKNLRMAFLLAGFGAFACASAEPAEKMIYLNLHMIGGRVYLDRAEVLPGRAKVDRFSEDKSQEIRYRVETESGALWLSGEMEDPSVLRVEPEEGAGFEVANSDTAYFSLKIPYRSGLGNMSFLRMHPWSRGLSKTGAATGDPIGSFSLSRVKE